MAKKTRAQRIRRKIADWILGDDTVLFTNGKTHELLKASKFLEASDEAVGKMFKHFWAVTSNYRDDEAKREGRSFSNCMISGSVLFLASEAARYNAGSADFTVTGSIDGGRTEGAWAVRIESDPNYQPVGGDAISLVNCPDDPEKIVEMRITKTNPSYEKWKAERLDTPTPTDEGKAC